MIDTGPVPRVVLLVEQGHDAQLVGPLRAAVRAAGGRIDWVPFDGVPLDRVPDAVGGTRLTPAAVAAVATVGVGLCTSPLAGPQPALDTALGLARYRLPAGDAGPAHTLLVLRDLAEGVGTGIELAAGSPAARELVSLFAAGRSAAPGTAVLDAEDAALAVGTRSAEVAGRMLAGAREYLRAVGVPLLTVVHKGNAVKCTDGILFRVATEAVPDRSPDGADAAPAVDSRIIDALCADLLLRPRRYRALLVPRLYADLVEALVAALAGRPSPTAGHLLLGDGLVLAGPRPSADPVADPEAARTGCLAAAVELLRHLGQDAAADRLDLEVAVREGAVREGAARDGDRSQLPTRFAGG